MVQIGKSVPAIKLEATGNQTISLKDFKDRYLVVYFYPKDSTPGCTREGQDFRDLYPRFQQLGCDVVGVSRDGIKAHENFKAKQSFPFDLLSDKEEKLCQAFDVIKEKNMYGRKYMGIERSTFLIDGTGKLRQEWRKVRVPGHAEAVLAALEELAS